jgi:hypothetical protein
MRVRALEADDGRKGDFAGYPSQPTQMRQRTTAGLLGRVPQWALKVGHFRCSATS